MNRKKRDPYIHYILGASLGTGIEPTAIAIVEQEITGSSSYRAETKALRLRHLERLPTDANLPAIVERFVKLMDDPKIGKADNCGGAEVVLWLPRHQYRDAAE